MIYFFWLDGKWICLGGLLIDFDGCHYRFSGSGDELRYTRKINIRSCNCLIDGVTFESNALNILTYVQVWNTLQSFHNYWFNLVQYLNNPVIAVIPSVTMGKKSTRDADRNQVKNLTLDTEILLMRANQLQVKNICLKKTIINISLTTSSYRYQGNYMFCLHSIDKIIKDTSPFLPIKSYLFETRARQRGRQRLSIGTPRNLDFLGLVIVH